MYSSFYSDNASIFQLIFSVGFLISTIILWGIFNKVNIRPWYSLIPFFREYVLTKLILGNGWLFLLLFIPFLGGIYAMYLSFKVAESFGKNILICLICAIFPIVLLFVAFDSSPFQGKYRYYQDESQNPYK